MSRHCLRICWTFTSFSTQVLLQLLADLSLSHQVARLFHGPRYTGTVLTEFAKTDQPTNQPYMNMSSAALVELAKSIFRNQAQNGSKGHYCFYFMSYSPTILQRYFPVLSVNITLRPYLDFYNCSPGKRP